MTERLNPDELDRLIDGLLDHDHLDRGELTDLDPSIHGYALLSAARQIRSLSEEPVPADVRDRHLAAIRQAAAERTAPAATAATGSNWLLGLRRRAAALAAATGLVFTATGGGAIAMAQDAAPGDALYGVKRASESVALAVTSDDARLHLQFAERRIEELAAAPEHAEELAPQAAEHLNNAQAHGAAADEAGAKAIESLTAVLANLPDEASNARIAVSRACARIAERHGHDAPDCDATGTPGKSGEAPRRNNAPGQNGNAPGDAPGRSGDAPRGGADTSDTSDGSDTDEGARPDDAGPPEGVPAPDGDDTTG